MAESLIFGVFFFGFRLVENVRDVFGLGLDLNGPRDIAEVVEAEINQGLVDGGGPRFALADLADEVGQNI